MQNIGHKELIAMLQRFQSRKEYAALKKSCESAVTEWRWATGQMLPELPHDDIVRGLKPAKWAKKQPRGGFLHGLGKNGHVQCMRSDERTKPDVYEQFLIHEDNGFWCVYFDNQAKKSVLAVKWFEMNGDRWLRSIQARHDRINECVLTWEGDRLVKCIERCWSDVALTDPPTAAAAKLRKTEVTEDIYSYTYAADGELERVTEERELGEGHPRWFQVKYQHVPKGTNLKHLLQEVEDILVAEIPPTIQAAKVPEPVHALLLQYTGVDTDLDGYAPPMYLPSDNLRRRLLEEHEKDRTWYPWAVQEWEGEPGVVRLGCENAALDEKLHLIFQLTVVQASPTNYGPVRKMFQRVCARLNALEWRGILKTTDDFIVIPYDPHGEMDLKVDLKTCVPVERLRLLMDRGYIGRMKVK
jgi:hypothetical protein